MPPEVIYKLNEIAINIPIGFHADTVNPILKYTKSLKSLNNKKNLEKA